MSEKLTDRLLSLADCDARAGEPLGKAMREAAGAIMSLSVTIEEQRKDLSTLRARVAEVERERDEAREKERFACAQIARQFDWSGATPIGQPAYYSAKHVLMAAGATAQQIANAILKGKDNGALG